MNEYDRAEWLDKMLGIIEKKGWALEPIKDGSGYQISFCGQCILSGPNLNEALIALDQETNT